jgi:drug/metabolite transporter (DMT)-like permease
MLTYLLAVLASCANAAASVLQRRANRRLKARGETGRGYLRSLLRNRDWRLGFCAVIAGFMGQAAALGTGKISVVEPLLVLELPFTLVLASWVFHTGLHHREWIAIAGMTAGLAVLLRALSPTGGDASGVPGRVWAIAIAATLTVVVGAAALGRRAGAMPGGRAESLSAATYGIAGGSLFGLTAALMKGALDRLPLGVPAVLASWQVYAMVVCGLLALAMLQEAMRAGQLLAAQPALTLSEPVVSIAWGALVFKERLHGGIAILFAVLGGAGIVGFVPVLSRSPLLAVADERPPPRD